MSKLLNIIMFCIALLGSCQLVAQEQEVKIRGKVIGENGEVDFINLFVVNQRTRIGNFGNPSGDFEIKVKRSDTILVGANGFATSKISIADSSVKESYYINVVLRGLEVKLKEVAIFAPRDLNEIYEDIEKLGFNRKDHLITGIDALQSPITALYASLSRKEQRKIEAYELMNEGKRRELLKELFKRFVDNKIIDLSEEQFDDFVDFCDVSDDFMKNSSQYEFIEFIKMKFRLYEEMTRFDDYDRDE